MLTQDEIIELKTQLYDQIQHLTGEQKIQAEKQIQDLSPEALEAMLSQQKKDKSVLRMIVDRELPAKIIDENKEAIAVVEIRPVAKGHIIIIPKSKVTKNMTNLVFGLARKTAKRISLKLKPKGIEIQTETKMGEQILDVMPYYDKPVSILSQRYEAKEKELEEVYHLLKATKRTPAKKQSKVKPQVHSNIIVLKRKIP